MNYPNDTNAAVLNRFHASFRNHYSRFVESVKGQASCKSCAACLRGDCKGISSISGGKFCLSRRLSQQTQSANEGGAMQSISHWLSDSDTHLPGLVTVQRLSRIFGCTVDELISDHSGRAEQFPEQALGHYFVFSVSQAASNYDLGLLSFVQRGDAVYAYFRFGRDDALRQVEDLKSRLDAATLTAAAAYKHRDYCGKCTCYNGNILIQMDYINATISDYAYFVIPKVNELQSNIIHKETFRSDCQRLIGGVGLCTTLSFPDDRFYWQEPIAFPFCFAHYMPDLSDELAQKIIEKIIRSRTMILDLESTEDWMNYLLDGISE